MTKIGARYESSTRAEKGRILDEFERVTGYHRKHAIRLLGADASALDVDAKAPHPSKAASPVRHHVDLRTVTTNRPFKDWPKVFSDPLNAQIIAERLTESAEVLLLEKSYRHRPKAYAEPADECPESATSPPYRPIQIAWSFRVSSLSCSVRARDQVARSRRRGHRQR